MQATIRKRVELPYLAYSPAGRAPASGRPTVIFLHGRGERGSDLKLVTKHGPPKLAEAGREFPFLLIAPQCPLDTRWPFELDALWALVKHVISVHKVDTERLYLTGLSMGGFGTWHLAAAHPRAFAAIVPICGGATDGTGFPERVRVLKDVPTWVFHGAKDPVVPISQSEVLVAALKEAGGSVRFTVYPEAGHDSWSETYDNPALYEWMLAQRNTRFRL